MKRSEHALQPFARRLIQLAVASCFATAVHANPTGPSVVSGAATFDAVGKNLTVTNTPGAIINWQGFSIRADEVTRFVQSGAASAVLNRVTGSEHSALLGQLLSNGRVFLINPNGVTVGAGAMIDTAGFVASSLNLSNEDFLAGKFRFTDPGTAGSVVNSGTINAGSSGMVYLIAPTVENHGVITAPGGEVMLAAGKSVEIVSPAHPDLRVQIQAGGEALNVGRLLAESGNIGIYGAVIRNGGTVSADSAQVSAAGTVILKASRDVTLDATSTLSASGAQGGAVSVQAETGTLLADGKIDAIGIAGQGGNVALLGERVGLVNAARVDASGGTSGGTVHIGGSRQGAGPLPSSTAVFVGADARVTANATDTGNGGTVIVYADDVARVHGAIEARGGTASGDGGFVETSGRRYLDVTATPDVSAPAGRGGEWLIDPYDITITTTANQCSNFAGCVAGPSWTSSGAPSQLGVNLINSALNAGTNVTVTTGAGGAGAGDIAFQGGANVSKTTAGSADATLTLQAHNNIDTSGATISAANNVNVGRLNVVLTADSDASGAGNVIVGSAVTTRGGSFTASGVNVSGAVAINSTGVQGRDGGAVSLAAAPTGAVNYTGAITANGGAASAASAGRSAGAVTVSGGTVSVGAITARGSNGAAGGNAGGNGGTVALTKTGVAATGATLNGLIDVRGGNSTGTATGGTGGSVTIDGGAGSIATTAANLATLIDARGGTGQDGGTATLSATGDIDIDAAGNKAILTNGGTAPGTTAGRNAGNITIASTGGTVTTRMLTANGSPAVGAGNNAGGSGGTIAVSGAGVTLNGAVSAIGGNSVNAGGAGSAGTVNVTGTTGTVSSVATGTINVTGGRGQDGGVVNVTAGPTGTVALAGTVTANGGAAETGSAGQAGGTIGVSGGTVTVGAMNARGTNAAAGSNAAGGSGGTVTLTKTGVAATAITLNGVLDVRGGNGNGFGNGNTGGTVTVNAGAGSIQGPGGSPGMLINAFGGTGQDGGTVTLTAVGAIDLAGGGNRDINVYGGAASTNNAGVPTSGMGRNGGVLTVSGGSVALDRIRANGTNAAGGSNKAGGSGGSVQVTAPAGTLALTNTVGANGGNRNGTGTGGSGGTITVNNNGTGTTTLAAAVTTASGTGQSGGPTSVTGGGPITVAAVTAGGDALLRSLPGAGNDVTLTGAIVSTGGSVTVASGEDIHYGTSTLSAPAGRWLTYSRNPANDTGTIPNPGGAQPNFYNCMYAGPCGVTVPAGGNHHVYSYQPLLTYTANPAARQYGDANPPFAGTVSGLVNGDTAAAAYSGTLAFMSAATGATPVGSYAVDGSGLVSSIGYGFVQAPGNATALTITPRPITVTANNQAKVYGDPDPAFTFTAPTVNGDVLNGTPVRAPGENVAGGPYAITQGTVTNVVNPNYNITFVNGQLVISPAPLQIAADGKVRLVDQPNPPFTATTTGFKLGDTLADLTGTLVLASPATTTSPAGAYPIVPGGVSSTNYTITFVDGVLIVAQATPPADNALISATGRNILLVSDAAVPGAVTNVDQCELIAPSPTQAGGLAAAQRTLNLAARGRPLDAPACETPLQ